MKILAILMELFSLIQQYGPQAGAILAKAETYIVAGDWTGLLAYVLSLVKTPPVIMSAEHTAALQAVHDKLAAATGN